MPAQALRHPAADAPRAQGAAPRPADEPSPARILTEAFDDLRRRMVNIEGRIVSLGPDADGGVAEAVARLEAKLEEGRPAGGRARRVVSLVLMGALGFGGGIVAADRLPEMAAQAQAVTVPVEAALRDGAAAVLALLPR